MQVYERVPSGLSIAQLLAFGRADRAAGRFALIRGAAAIAFMIAGLAPWGPLWFLIGSLLLLSLFPFVRAAGRAATIRPSLVLTGTPKWDGTRRISWEVRADDAPQTRAAAQRILDGLTAELGQPLSARIQGEDTVGVSIRSVLAVPDPGDPVSLRPGVVAWGVGRAPRLAADGDTNGVWMRIDAPGEERPVVTVLCNEGEARATLTRVAWRA